MYNYIYLITRKLYSIVYIYIVPVIAATYMYMYLYMYMQTIVVNVHVLYMYMLSNNCIPIIQYLHGLSLLKHFLATTDYNNKSYRIAINLICRYLYKTLTISIYNGFFCSQLSILKARHTVCLDYRITSSKLP